MDQSKLSRILNPRDRSILDAQAETVWIPPEPRDLLLPYINEDQGEDDPTGVSTLQTKAKQVFDDYGAVIERCRTLEMEIEQKCKNVKVPIQTSNKSIADSIKRAFGTNGEEITFDMYKKCIQALAAIGDGNIPTPDDKGN